MKIILGSSSKLRQKGLIKAGFVFDVIMPNIDEKSIRQSNPKDLVLAIALAKSNAITNKIKGEAVVITADSVVIFKCKIVEKPVSNDEVVQLLSNYYQSPVYFYTGLVTTNTQTGKIAKDYDVSEIFFKPVPKSVIDEYIRTKLPFTQAGGFDPNHPLVKPYILKVNESQGSLQGMPINLVKKLIKEVL